jgi:hypothetical protein
MVSVPKFHYPSGDKNTHVAICIPVRDHVTAVFTHSLALLTKKCGESNQKISLHMIMGSEVAMQRQQLADEAMETKATHVLWLDSDMHFPSNVLQGLLSHNKDIIACNYSTRVKPHRPVAFKSENDLDARVHSGTGIEKIWAIGMGCMLVKREVFESMDRPYFSVSWNEDYTGLMGEDIWFCNKAKQHGYDIWLEHDLSEHIAHVGTREYTIKGDCND